MLTDSRVTKDLKQVGQSIEFETVFMSANGVDIFPATISCPMSGNYLLTESAKIISGEWGEEEARKMLEAFFYNLEKAASAKEALAQGGGYAALDLALKKAASRFLEAAKLESEENPKDEESLRFEFLKQCSKNFTCEYERIKI